MKAAALALALGATVLTAGAHAQALKADGAKTVADLLGDGYSIATVTPNSRPGEIVMILRKETKTFVCAISDVRSETYGEAKAKPTAQPCLPLN